MSKHDKDDKKKHKKSKKHKKFITPDPPADLKFDNPINMLLENRYLFNKKEDKQVQLERIFKDITALLYCYNPQDPDDPAVEITVRKIMSEESVLQMHEMRETMGKLTQDPRLMKEVLKLQQEWAVKDSDMPAEEDEDEDDGDNWKKETPKPGKPGKK